MGPDSSLYVLDTFWDRQDHEAAAFSAGDLAVLHLPRERQQPHVQVFRHHRHARSRGPRSKDHRHARRLLVSARLPKALKNYLPKVRELYRSFPFPARDPAAESPTAIPISRTDILGKVNHHGFGGRRDFTRRFRR